MRRVFMYMLILAIVLVLPLKGTDVGKLRPIQTIAVYTSGSGYTICTDTMDSGFGETVSLAVEDLKATTPAIIYLDTAQYLIVDEPSAIAALRPYLRSRVRVYQFYGEPPMDVVSEFLSAQGDGPTVIQWEKGAKIPVLDCRDGRLLLR